MDWTYNVFGVTLNPTRLLWVPISNPDTPGKWLYVMVWMFCSSWNPNMRGGGGRGGGGFGGRGGRGAGMGGGMMSYGGGGVGRFGGQGNFYV